MSAFTQQQPGQASSHEFGSNGINVGVGLVEGNEENDVMDSNGRQQQQQQQQQLSTIKLGQIGTTAQSSKENEDQGKMFQHVMVRVKRKRTEVAEAPSILIIPKKKRLTLENAFSKLEMDEKNKPVVNVEEQDQALVFEKAHVAPVEPRKRKMVEEEEEEEEEDEQDTNNNDKSAAKSAKRQRFMDLEINSSTKRITERRVRLVSDKKLEEMDFAIWHAFRSGDFLFCENLLCTQEIDINYQRETDGVTALMAACAHGNAQVVKRLLDWGADASITDANGLTARDHIGKCFGSEDLVPESMKQEVVTLLDGSDYVYDVYVMKKQINLGPQAGVDSSIWKEKGIPTEWQDGFVCDFQFDFEKFLEETEKEELVDGRAEDSSVEDPDEEDDPDSERYKYNDYPDDEDDDDDQNLHGLSSDDDDEDNPYRFRNQTPFEHAKLDYDQQSDENEDDEDEDICYQDGDNYYYHTRN